ncbi:acetoin utilization protein AcuC [Micrococcoides hystricis]|uniref:Acetoin utilization protein AcuC n=1 Tax=Micrococcoides hystricis TaxID=1572761 RepID=A0ABV6PD72_9MICC
MKVQPDQKIPTTVLWDEAYLAYKFSESHPMAPKRLDMTARLAEDLGLFSLPQISIEAPYVASDEELAWVHEPEYVQAVRDASAGKFESMPERGLGTEDDPIFPALHEASARIGGGSLVAAEQILSEKSARAVNFAGGMHHAMPEKAAGFCVYNDAAMAIHRMLDAGVQRVVYIDIDAHHGDGVERMFWNEPRVLTISVHETGLSLFPGTGFANEIGGPDALGSAVNLALPPGTGDGAWLRAFHAIVPQLVRAFEPEIIVSQHGCDSHSQDPLTNLELSVDAQRQAAIDIGQLAKEVCENRWLSCGGGGYNPVAVVPRSWAHLIAVTADEPLPVTVETPERWRRYVKEAYGVEAPEKMGDDVDLWWRSWEVGYNPNDDVDRTIMATRKEVFPLYGLDPWFD